MDVYMSPVDVMAGFFGDGSAGGVELGMGVGGGSLGMEVGLFGPEMSVGVGPGMGRMGGGES
jgi:hypothetical protein